MSVLPCLKSTKNAPVYSLLKVPGIEHVVFFSGQAFFFFHNPKSKSNGFTFLVLRHTLLNLSPLIDICIFVHSFYNMLSFRYFLLAFLALLPLASAVKFSVESKAQGNPPRCIRDFVNKGKMVVVKIKTSGEKGDGQVLNLNVS